MTEGPPPFALSPFAASSCPVKTQNEFNPLVNPAVTVSDPVSGVAGPVVGSATDHWLEWAVEPVWPKPRDQMQANHVIQGLLAAHRSDVRDLRQVEAGESRIAACLAAMNQGVAVIVAAELPVDWRSHRRGTADLLVRGADSPSGAVVYRPLLIRGHHVLAATSDGRGNQLVGSLAELFLRQAQPKDRRFRVEAASADLIQLAHLWHLLQNAGFADEEPWAGVIGTDQMCEIAGPVVVWANLADKQIMAFAYAGGASWKKHSALSRYQHEFRFHVRVAAHAMQQGGAASPELVAAPVRIAECDTCRWWPVCQAELDDDISTTIERSPLDAKEIMTLRNLGVTTTVDLAAADVDSLLPAYLPAVAHRSGAEARLRLAAHRGRLITSGTKLERLTAGPIDLPATDLEIDLDIETSAHGHIYLWGFLVDDRRSGEAPYYHPVSRFTTLTATKELLLAEEAALWLQELVESADGASVSIWHYSNYEPSALRHLARTRPKTDTGLDWLADYVSGHFVDLLPLVKRNFFGVDGLGLKAVATEGAGFSWRDPDPSGLNSQFWFADSVHGATAEVRQAAVTRVLEYNEDDVRATWAVRQWLRSLD